MKDKSLRGQKPRADSTESNDSDILVASNPVGLVSKAQETLTELAVALNDADVRESFVTDIESLNDELDYLAIEIEEAIDS